MTEKEEYSYEINEFGKAQKIDPIKCPNCGSTSTEIGVDYLYCFKCEGEVRFPKKSDKK